MNTPDQTSTSSPTGSLTPSSEGSAKMGRTSSMPDERRYTERLRRLRDSVPKRSSSIIFTGASCAKMNRRLVRLAPPKGRSVVSPQNTETPGYYGGDVRKFEKRTKRYIDGKNIGAKRGGAPVFSGSSGAAYVARMMRVQDRH